MEKINFENIKINNGFWKTKQDMIKNSTLYSVYNRFADTHRFSALACDPSDKTERHIFWDSDVAKWIEGASYILKEKRDENLEKIIDEAVDNIVKNSDENGYFNSYFLTVKQDMRFKNRDAHELYCAGHLIEAAIAYNDATKKDKFLKAMCKYADYIEKVFKIQKSAAFATDGHPEIELALVKLYCATGEKRYLELAKYFIDIHGFGENFSDWGIFYNQDDMPLRRRTTAVGHCVRALYLYCAMADIAKHYGDSELADACKRVFDDIVLKKMYITGGVGSTHIGEAFSVPYYLPNKTAYNETCAAIALAMFCERMQQSDINSKYADIAERVLYNGILSGVSMDGKSFFYENPLETDPVFNNVNPSTKTKERFPITTRVEVFECSCCPPNIVRFIPSVAGLMYTYDDSVIYVHQYINSTAEHENIKISQKTNYPADSVINIKCSAPQKQIALRIPSWCTSFSINAPYSLKNGYAYIDLSSQSEIVLKLDMPVTFIKSNKLVHENAGKIAVMRGPVVYCAESADNGSDLKSYMIDVSSAPEVKECDFLLPSITVKAYKEKSNDSLYYQIGNDCEQTNLKLIPYYAFANRGESEMLVWFLKK